MRVFHQKNTAAAIEYYTELSEYYGPGSEKKRGVYFGKGAARLGLSPGRQVDEETFSKLCRNIDPRTESDRLTERNHANRRVLTDLTFSAPKSVSLMWGLTEDDRLLDALQQSVLQTMEDVEQDVMSRVNHRRGEMSLKKTRNLVGVAWTHTTSRPVGDHPDPQLHVHATIINATHDVQKDRWTAADLSAVVRDSGYYEALFQSRLAGRIQQLGYRIERSEHNFEIKGMSRSLIEKFSRRTEQIDKRAKALGIENKDVKDALGAMTRGNKAHNLVPPDELPDKWRSRLTDEETNQVEAAKAAGRNMTPKKSTARQAVEYAVAHLFAKQSVVRKRQLTREALLHGICSATPEQIETEFAARELIRKGTEEEEEVTTKEVLAEEQKVVSFARRTRGQFEPLNEHHTIERHWLSDEQQRAINGLLRSSDGLQVLRGAAGSGKTTLMQEAIEAMEAAGHRATVLAPQGETAQAVLREQEGFDANTLASFLLSKRAQSRAAKGVIWIDEAGQIGMHDMARLTEVAERIDARIVLSGDHAQHKAVSRGQPLRLLETEAGITPHQVRTIRRQQGDDYRQAVTHFSQGEIAKGFEKLDEMQSVHEISDLTDRAQAIAGRYADALEDGKSTLVVAPSHAEREQVTDAIRTELKARGHIHHDERQISVLKSRRLSEAQRADSHSYQAGEDVIEFHRNAKGGFRSGSRVFVAEVRGSKVYTKTDVGLVEVPITSPASFDVYRARAIDVAIGDTLRITKRRKPTPGENSKQLNNGSLVTLTGFAKNGNLKLSNGQQLGPGWGHFDHGITITSHASQGKTFDNVIIAQSSLSFPASSKEQAYVSASRGRQRIDWFTDSADDLRSAIQRERPAKHAFDIKPKPDRTSVGRRRELYQRISRIAAQRAEQLRRWLSQQQTERARA